MVAPAVPATADDSRLGWLRLQPAEGPLDVATAGLTEAPCPDGAAVNVTITGPGVAANNQVGAIVGYREVDAIPPTVSGQLLVNFSYTFRDWFSRNVPSKTPDGTYIVRLTCLVGFPPTSVGSYLAQVQVIDGRSYRALGEAAKPFDTQVRSAEPFPVESPDPASSASPSTASSSPPAAPSASASGGSGATESPSAADPSAGPADPSAAPQPSTQAAAQESASTSGGGVRGVLIAIAVLLVGGAAAATWWRRRSSS
jgi:hypothetical protein